MCWSPVKPLIINITVALGFRDAQEIFCESDDSQREGTQGDMWGAETMHKGQRWDFYFCQFSPNFCFMHSLWSAWSHFSQICPSELPEPAVRGLCKLFCLTPHRYRWVRGFIHKHSDHWRSELKHILSWKYGAHVQKFVCSSGMLHHAECSSLSLASWLRLSLKSWSPASSTACSIVESSAKVECQGTPFTFILVF